MFSQNSYKDSNSKDISKNISEIRTYNSNVEKASNLVRHVDALLIQAGDLVKQMEVEVRSHDAATRKLLSDKVNQYKRTLQSLRSDFDTARAEAQKSSLLSGGAKSNEHRQKMISTNEK